MERCINLWIFVYKKWNEMFCDVVLFLLKLIIENNLIVSLIMINSYCEKLLFVKKLKWEIYCNNVINDFLFFF